MPLSINVGLSRKASKDYQSSGVSINVTAELDQSLLAKPDELQHQIDNLYAQAQAAMDRQLPDDPHTPHQREPQRQPSRNGARYDRNAGNGNGNRGNPNTNGNGNGNHGGNGRGGSMTESQGKAIAAISRRLNINPDGEAFDLLGLGLDELTIRQASELIDHLKALQAAGDGHNGSGR